MTPEYKEKVKLLRQKLSSLTEQEKQAFIDRGIIATIEGRQLSLHNTLLVYLQCNGKTPTVVGGYQQWRQAGKHVNKGEHGYTIWFPVGDKDEQGDVKLARQFFTTTVFDISQVMEAI